MSSKKGNKGMGILDYLGIVFVILKLLNVITWSWLLVISPFIIDIILTVILTYIHSRRDR